MVSRTTNRRRELGILAPIGVVLVVLACGRVPAEPEQRPNILILMADDWNWPQSQGVSDPNLQTPTFDRIAAEGIRFTNAFVDSPSCKPSP